MKTSSSQLKPPLDLAGYDPTRGADDYTWDAAEAERVLEFFPRFLTHIEGPIAGQAFEPNPWEKDFLATLFGWKRANGTRRYREFFVAIPRKNNKTTLCAGLALYLLLCDGEAGAQIYLAAGSAEQAGLLHRTASAMVAGNKRLAEMCQVFQAQTGRRIVCQQTNSFIRTLPADADVAHGLNAHGVIIDEIHVQPNRNLYDVLKTSTVARRQPITGSITTAGHDRETICYELWEHARNVRDGITADPAFLPVIFEKPADADWTEPETWKAVNPNFNRSVPLEYLEEAFARARKTVSFENTFRRLHLNEWTESDVRWIGADDWSACQGEMPELTGRACVVGIDMASTDDLTALVYVFPMEGKFYVKSHFYVPAETISRTEKRYQSQYAQWVKDGWLVRTPGSATDYAFLRQQIFDDAQKYQIQEVGFDAHLALDTVQQLQARGLECTKILQNCAGLFPGVKAIEESVLDRRIVHDGNPCLAWQIASTVLTQDEQGNRKPSKKKSQGDEGTRGKIDGVVALCMAMSLTWEDTGNVYDERGVLTL